MASSLDFLAILGLPASGTEVFQGLGGGLVSVTGTPTPTTPGQTQTKPPEHTEISETETFSDDLWKAQQNLIEKQSDYLAHLSKELATKWEDIPAKLKDRTVKDTMLEEFLKWAAGKIAEYFWGAIGKEIATLSVALVAIAIRLLKALYSDGQALCDAMQAENDALSKLEQSRENYELRSKIVTQHDITINNLLTEIHDAERHVSESLELKDISETLKMIQAEDNIVQCPTTGKCISTRSLVIDDEELDA
jgi:hypothetical protein